MTSKWNLGDIVPSDREKKPARRLAPVTAPTRPEPTRLRPEPSAEEPRPPRRPESHRPRKKRRWLWVVIILIVAVAGGVAFGALFAGANVTVYPKTRTVNVDAELVASQTAPTGELAYEILELTAEEESLVTATGQEEVSEQASGSITIYNEFSQTPQRLITNTRFESADGLIFRMTESVNVPGFTRNADGSVTPGSIKATIYASETGEEYNIPAGKLTVPGLSDNPEQFAKIYAQLDGPTTGGFEGLKYIVPDAELATTRSELQEKLRTTLLNRLVNERPNGFVLFESAIVLSYATVSTMDAGNQQVALREQAKLQVPIFPMEAFAGYIASRTLPGYEGEPVRIENPATLGFAYGDPIPTTLSGEDVTFNLSGTARVIWNYDAEELRRDLQGVSKNGVPVVVSGYPAIDHINTVVKPFWKNNLPDDIQKITITERLE